MRKLSSPTLNRSFSKCGRTPVLKKKSLFKIRGMLLNKEYFSLFFFSKNGINLVSICKKSPFIETKPFPNFPSLKKTSFFKFSSSFLSSKSSLKKVSEIILPSFSKFSFKRKLIGLLGIEYSNLFMFFFNFFFYLS